MNTNTKLMRLTNLLSVLIYVRENASVRHNRLGICDAVHHASLKMNIHRYSCNSLTHYFCRWPEFSGDILFPIRSVTHRPSAAFSRSQFKWSKWTIYGRRRWRLLHWMIAEVKKDIECLRLYQIPTKQSEPPC